MACPVRAAALQALEIIKTEAEIDTSSDEEFDGMSSGEEEELDRELCMSDDSCDLSQDEEEAEDSSSRPRLDRFMSYGYLDGEPDSIEFRPERPPGPNLPDPDGLGAKRYTKSIDFFSLFMTREIIEMLCRNTNYYGWLMIHQKTSYAAADGSWVEVSEEEMLAYLGLIVMMGIIDLPNIARYWSQATMYSGGWSSRFLSRNRYKALSGMLHVTHPSSEDSSDCLTKIRPLLEHIKKKCSELYQPHQDFCVDERMVRSKGRSGLKQYMPNKHTKFGYKLWCLCQSSTGYTLDFDIYTGRKDKPRQYNLAFDVVSSLVDKYVGQGYKCYFDNYFTSLALVQHLRLNGFGACGTTLPNRRGFPEALKNKRWTKKAKKGDTRFFRIDGILCQQWMDSKPVCICSNMHKGTTTVTVKRHRKKPDGSNEKITVRKPKAISDYNANMGGVDLSDQRMEPYNILHKSRQWWKTLFFHLLDMSIFNCYLMFTEWQQLHPDIDELQRPAGYSHLDFREELARQLGCISDDEDIVTPRIVPCGMRFFGMDAVHVPRHEKNRRNCYVCYLLSKKPVRTHWYCSHDRCNVPICLNSERNCFALWHTDEFQRLCRRTGR